MPARQRVERIEPSPKTIHKLDTWSDPGTLMADAMIARAVVHLIRAIENGTPLPSGYHRKGVGLDRDGLLADEGSMHLHLGRSNTSELLYLIQYPDDVVLLELSDHRHFASRPVGARLLTRHGAAIGNKEARLAADPNAPRRPIIKRRSRLRPVRPVKPSTGHDPKDG